MSKLRLTMACEDYDRTRPLIDGTITPEGVDLNVIRLNTPERHARMMQRLEFDVCELSTGQFLSGKTRGLGITAIAAFPYRLFRHGYVFVNSNAGIDKPADLVGKRIGVSMYTNTAAMWMRGILEDEYGLRYDQVTWVTANPEEAEDWKPPEGVKIELCTPDPSIAGRVTERGRLNALLVSGEVDALIFPAVIPAIQDKDPRVRRLFANAKQLEMDFYRRTKLFPIMHSVVIKDSVLQEHPWVAASVLKAFDRAKDWTVEYYRNEARTPLLWFGAALREQQEIVGPDPWAYGIKANRHTLEKMVEYAHHQGIIAYKPTLEELFVEGGREPIPEPKR